jgi:hypothetical protein
LDSFWYCFVGEQNDYYTLLIVLLFLDSLAKVKLAVDTVFSAQVETARILGASDMRYRLVQLYLPLGHQMGEHPKIK